MWVEFAPTFIGKPCVIVVERSTVEQVVGIVAIGVEAGKAGHFGLLNVDIEVDGTIADTVAVLHLGLYLVLTLLAPVACVRCLSRVGLAIHYPYGSHTGCLHESHCGSVGRLIYRHAEVIGIVGDRGEVAVSTIIALGRASRHGQSCEEDASHIFKYVFHIACVYMCLFVIVLLQGGVRIELGLCDRNILLLLTPSVGTEVGEFGLGLEY